MFICDDFFNFCYCFCYRNIDVACNKRLSFTILPLQGKEENFYCGTLKMVIFSLPCNQFPCPFTIFPLFGTEHWWLIVNFAVSFASVAVTEVLKKNFSSYSAGKCSDCCSGRCSRECSCNQKSIQSPRITTEKTHWTIFVFSGLFMVTCFSGSVSPSVPDVASQHEVLGTGSLHSLSHLNVL